MKKEILRKNTAIALSLLLTAGALTSCGMIAGAETSSSASSATSAATDSEAGESSNSAGIIRTESKFGALFLTADDINIKDSDAYSDDWKNGNVTEITEATEITEEGTYVISGSISGTITVNADEDAKVRLILNGAEIVSDDGPAIEVKGGDKVSISLAPNTENTLKASGLSADDDVNAAIYSKSDLVLNGSGTLTIESSQDGIHSTDDLRITGGTYNVKASDDGLVAKDRLEITDGTFTIDAGAKGMKTTNEEDAEKGFLYIAGGSFDITAADDGINVKTAAWITGGTFKIQSGDDAIHADGTLTIDDGQIDVTSSVEGLEAPEIVLNGGDVNVNASDDGINAAGGQSSGSTSTDQSNGQDGTDQSNDQNGGASNIQPSSEIATPVAYENGQSDETSGQTVDQESQFAFQPGGQNGEADGNWQGDGTDSGWGQKGHRAQNSTPDGGQMPDGQYPGDAAGNGGGFDNENSEGYLTINGGTIYVNAGGDGLDANTSITQTGGDVTVEGPTNNGNGALDYGQTYDMTGGTLLAVGSSGMMQGISDGSSIPGIAVRLSTSLEKGTVMTIKDSSGTEVKSLTLSKSIESVVFASPDLKSGETYTISNGSTEVGSATAS